MIFFHFFLDDGKVHFDRDFAAGKQKNQEMIIYGKDIIKR